MFYIPVTLSVTEGSFIMCITNSIQKREREVQILRRFHCEQFWFADGGNVFLAIYVR